MPKVPKKAKEKKPSRRQRRAAIAEREHRVDVAAAGLTAGINMRRLQSRRGRRVTPRTTLTQFLGGGKKKKRLGRHRVLA